MTTSEMLVRPLNNLLALASQSEYSWKFSVTALCWFFMEKSTPAFACMQCALFDMSVYGAVWHPCFSRCSVQREASMNQLYSFDGSLVWVFLIGNTPWQHRHQCAWNTQERTPSAKTLHSKTKLILVLQSCFWYFMWLAVIHLSENLDWCSLTKTAATDLWWEINYCKTWISMLFFNTTPCLPLATCMQHMH